MKLWGGRFNTQTHHLVDEYNASIGFDYQLADFDILGSLAHIKMLGKCQLLSNEDVTMIKRGLRELLREYQHHGLSFSVSDEDIHMNIERLLHEKIGKVAGKLHTGRSRNDQIALDLHLYVRHHLIIIVTLFHSFLKVILQVASDHIDTILPGYTHLQRAEPIRFAHHLLAYFQMFSRDVGRLCNSFSEINRCPLGAGALAGSGVPVDRKYIAELLKFDGMYTNSLDAVSDRDFIVEFLSNASLAMMHFSRLSEEIILWSSQEFSFIQLDDAFCTGSSMMPQKKNPDVSELARGKTGRMYGALMNILTVLKGLPLAYNKDMQEDKESLFDSVKTLTQTLSVYNPMLKTMKVNCQSMYEATQNSYMNATHLANYLVSKQIPFRRAHEITGNIVLFCIENHCLLKDLSLEQFRTFHEEIDSEVYQYLDMMAVVEAHQAKGGTSKQSVKEQLLQAEKELDSLQRWIHQHQPLLELIPYMSEFNED